MSIYLGNENVLRAEGLEIWESHPFNKIDDGAAKILHVATIHNYPDIKDYDAREIAIIMSFAPDLMMRLENMIITNELLLDEETAHLSPHDECKFAKKLIERIRTLIRD